MTHRENIAELVSLVARLESSGRAVLGAHILTEHEFDPPIAEPAGLGFYQTVPYLYVQYFERGRVSVPFLLDKAAALYDVDLSGHKLDVHALRTFCQHARDPSSDHDARIRARCHAWFRLACGAPVPGADPHWDACLGALLVAATNFVAQLLNVLERLGSEPLLPHIAADYCSRASRRLAPHEVDATIAERSNILGIPVAARVLRERIYQDLSRKVEFLPDGGDPRELARRFIDEALVTQVQIRAPISGDDVMTLLAIGPGKRVGELFRWALSYHGEHGGTRSELLEALRRHASEGGGQFR